MVWAFPEEMLAGLKLRIERLFGPPEDRGLQVADSNIPKSEIRNPKSTIADPKRKTQQH